VLEWRDTLDVPAQRDVRFAVSFDPRPGTWMFHCHILDHAEIGMMGTLHVMP
jgi:FtsP/CotA-like multicopper oxidase with cupredoxin domain